MVKLLKINRAAALLMLAANMPLNCQMAFAEPTSSVGSNSSTQGVANNTGTTARQPKKNGNHAEARIPSTNPDDANKHPAWRKREANKNIVNLPKIKKSMMEQGAQ